MACGGCIKDEAEDEETRNNIFSHTAATDTSPPWNEACRNCNVVKADPHCWIVKEEEAEACSLAIKKEKEDNVPLVLLLCSTCM